MSERDTYRDWSAAYVLGALDPAERAEFEAHVTGCDACRKEVASLAPLPGLLRGIDLGAPLEVPESVVARATEKIGFDLSAMRASRNRWRWVAVAAVAIMVVVSLVGSWPSTAPEGATIAIDPGAKVQGSILVEEKAWGTAVYLELSGLPESEYYRAWAISDAGEREQIASWGPTPSRVAKVSGASSIPTGSLRTVVVTGGDEDDELAVVRIET